MQSPLLALARTIDSHLKRLDVDIRDVRVEVDLLRQAATSATLREFPAHTSHYAGLVERALSAGLTGPAKDIAAALAHAYQTLPWVYHYSPRNAAEDLSDRIAFAELIGPDGPLSSPSGRVGFTVMADHTRYPLHAHPAVELYLVISGHAQWSTPLSSQIVPPGRLVLHHSGEPHAMETRGEPLLALWGWSGETEVPAAYI